MGALRMFEQYVLLESILKYVYDAFSDIRPSFV